MMTDIAEATDRIAREFHATYERLAPQYGYQTRPESAVNFDDLPIENRMLMLATVASLLSRGVIR